MTIKQLKRICFTLYRRQPIGARIYLRLRLMNFPLNHVWPLLLSAHSPILSIGAGYGVFETLLALENPSSRIFVSDIDKRRIAIARQATRSLLNISFEALDITKRLPPGRPVKTILLFDLLHHIDQDSQRRLIERAAKILNQGGQLIIKDIGITPRWKYWFNWLHDYLMTRGQPVYYRSLNEWEELLKGNRFSVAGKKIDAHSPYPHILIIAQKLP